MLKPFKTIELDSQVLSVIESQYKKNLISPNEKSRKEINCSIQNSIDLSSPNDQYYFGQRLPRSPIARSNILPSLYEDSKMSNSNYFPSLEQTEMFQSHTTFFNKNGSGALKLHHSVSSPKINFKRKEGKKKLSPSPGFEKSPVPPVGTYDLERGFDLVKKKRVIPIIFNQRKTDRLEQIPRRKLIPSKYEISSMLNFYPMKKEGSHWERELKKEINQEINYKRIQVPVNESAKKIVTNKSHFKKMSPKIEEDLVGRNLRNMNDKFHEVRLKIQDLRVSIFKKD